eukprot:CAMPEP_0168498738 /NCGR_PEP_ID=MMETSP0228-20121227/73429_1 /TAXON_ID=133427 /ORGANISM="Protoceratium reticulatum, Strain CCCM 535 (=CCMP 1889)" /LENGTH=601 /DNA_ID=CAMNT_0008515641 /DNA_START=33 /DNA_END=1835 /DNA_ORIENTATION=-
MSDGKPHSDERAGILGVSQGAQPCKRSVKVNKIPGGHWPGAPAPPRPAVGLDDQVEGKNGGAVLGQFCSLRKDLKMKLEECALSSEDRASISRCLEHLSAVAAELGPGWRVELFGSVANGFGTRASDLDATCLRAARAPGEAPDCQAATWLLRAKLAPLLRKRPDQFEVAELVLGAKVPLLRLRYTGRLDVDLTIRNAEAIRNTRLLRAYANFDPRVREVGIAVKLWAKAAGVCGASQNRLSSYTFALMAIYFLQVHPEVGLPCLPTALFEDGMAGEWDEQVQAQKRSWTCRFDSAYLLASFLWFYTLRFKWGQEVVSIRIGNRLPNGDVRYQRLRGRRAERLHVEDPFCTERNLHCVLGEKEEEQLREAFAASLTAVLEGGTPKGLLPERRDSLERQATAGSAPQVSAGAKNTVLAPAGAAKLLPAEHTAPHRAPVRPADCIKADEAISCPTDRILAAKPRSEGARSPRCSSTSSTLSVGDAALNLGGTSLESSEQGEDTSGARAEDDEPAGEAAPAQFGSWGTRELRRWCRREQQQLEAASTAPARAPSRLEDDTSLKARQPPTQPSRADQVWPQKQKQQKQPQQHQQEHQQQQQQQQQ